MVEDIITLVKGGVLDSSTGVLVIRNPETYRRWGASLKYNPTLIEQEVSSDFTHKGTFKPFLSSLFSLTFLPDYANLRAGAVQHSRRPCWRQTGQPAESLGGVHAAV